VPPAIPQPSTGATSCTSAGNCLDSLDGRLTQAVAHYDPDANAEAIWTQHTIADASVGTLAVERWYELIPGRSTPRQAGNVSDPSLYIFNGAISPSSAGNEAAIFYNAGNGSVGGFASFRVRSRSSSTPIGTMTSETIIASDAVNDNDYSCGVNRSPANLALPCRWGDYSAARPDPLDANAVWGTNMLTGTGGTTTTAGWRTAIAAYTNGCSSTSLSPHTANALTGTVNQFTATSMGCGNARYQFLLRYPAGTGSWTIKQAFGAANTWTWDSSGYPAGNYDIQVWANQTGDSTANWEAMDIANFTLNQSPPCSSVTETAAPASTSASGTSVTFTASASGCPNPRYQFWVLAPGSSTWQVVQAYSSGSTFSWNTTGLIAGNYMYTVWARDAGSAGTSSNSLGSFDSYSPATTYPLTSTPCSAVTESAAPTSAASSATVTFTAGASGCAHPLYQFWTLAPGGSWTVGQAYSTATTFNWNTTGSPAGTYHYTVWVRDSGSAGTSSNSLGSFDAYFPSTAYTVTGGPACTSVTDSPAPATTATSSTTVTFTAAASGCPHPLYQFWILPPGGSWTIGQAYSTTATFNWNTTGLPAGAYHYTVWVRDSGSVGTSTNSLGSFDTYSPSTAYTLTTTPCTSVTESAAPPSTATTSSTVTFTASASGCGHPLYQFWILVPGSSTWQIAQPYSAGATFNWNTIGLRGGTYRYTVWVRDASSAGTSTNSLGSFDAYSPATTYTLN
jgi:hypothetical protein